MKILAVLMCIAVQGVLSRPIILRLPCDEIDLHDVNITTKGQILQHSATQIYEAREGNIIEKITYYNNVLFSAERNDEATIRRLYVEATKTDTLMAIESIYPNRFEMRYFRVEGHEAIRITFLQFIGMLHGRGLEPLTTRLRVWRSSD
ncbi:hypothetical protein MACK_003782 [Theileria orientalis]|uniref:Uncharacterized protein n=1 Tax=Theileria orientalis TaxID=68886 RepID=A0A976SIW4_THEOR|nr:hypothetical protein MACK_003782 [Theileria orientalis]